MSNPLLEYVNRRTLRAHLARLKMFLTSFGKETRKPRLRRQALRHIELKLSPQPSFTPPRPTSRAECKTAAFPQFTGEVGQAGVTSDG
jgi:hypothetical protein